MRSSSSNDESSLAASADCGLFTETIADGDNELGVGGGRDGMAVLRANAPAGAPEPRDAADATGERATGVGVARRLPERPSVDVAAATVVELGGALGVAGGTRCGRSAIVVVVVVAGVVLAATVVAFAAATPEPAPPLGLRGL